MAAGDAGSARALSVTVVDACLRGGGGADGGRGGGGSPTAVLDDAPLTDEERRRLPVELGTSHAVFVSAGAAGAPVGAAGAPVGLRFFTSAGELPACGHGTVAALAVLAERAGAERAAAERFECELRTPARTFSGHCVRRGDRLEAMFEPGPVEAREATATERELVLPALAIGPGDTAPGVRAASLGRWRLLVPVRTRAALTALAPDLDRLRQACERTGLLGCYVHSVPDSHGVLAARMFAPAIGVPEDIANANSTACLAATTGAGVGAGAAAGRLVVDMGDSLGSPATVIATTGSRDGTGAGGARVEVGGAARIARVVRWSP
ncbi:PhzF family phenazine biosynthesis protein [Streptomyces mangrovisoli]|uniref:Phenazine biosynthesis protein PhzF n=1 Tax=Streptomyces mangrovisoli TaxID=1428628 RepID=A0A1J4P6L2_9ACTN|nr:PhzF family phenazine biosynthesis protein [Streptomyces mangrovisoli]OIJ69150.1 hypothetical protein WN71_004245 [Streptomyces mangrovisoli]